MNRVSLFAVASLSLLACKDVTETVVEKGVKSTKETAKGIEEGFDKGRKEGESVDGAVIVSSAAELSGKGSVTVYSVSEGLGQAPLTTVVLGVENLGNKPLRLTKLTFVALDKEKFSKPLKQAPAEVTVPPNAKEKISIAVEEVASKLAKIRYWDVELEIPAQAVAKPAVAPSVKKASTPAASKGSLDFNPGY